MLYLPTIRDIDYPTLKAAMGSEVPDTYGGGLDLLADWERGRPRREIARVEINPSQYAQYMTNAGRKLDLDALLAYAAFNPWRDPD
jgi:hypothetical protein